MAVEEFKDRYLKIMSCDHETHSLKCFKTSCKHKLHYAKNTVRIKIVTNNSFTLQIRKLKHTKIQSLVSKFSMSETTNLQIYFFFLNDKSIKKYFCEDLAKLPQRPIHGRSSQPLSYAHTHTKLTKMTKQFQSVHNILICSNTWDPQLKCSTAKKKPQAFVKRKERVEIFSPIKHTADSSR